jgi:fructokinase
LTHEPARSATQKAVAYAKSKGKLITYDPNLRKPLWSDPELAKEQLLWGLAQADVVKISDDEVRFLFGLDPVEGAQYILDHFDVQLVFVTCGAEGCYFQNSVAKGMVPSLKGIQVADTTGAGDIFGGSVVWKLLQLPQPLRELPQHQLEDAVRFACTSAALSTTKPGGITSVPDMADIEKYLA